MPMFHEHPDDLLYVRTDTATYVDTWQNFERDFGEPLEELPAGVIERVYVPGVRHALNSADSTLRGGERVWNFGDRAIAAIDQLLAAQAARRPVV